MKKTYIIAEIGNTHEGSLGLAKQFMKVAAECGADAVKMQTHIFEAESLPDAPNPPYFKDETREEYFNRTGFNIIQWRELKRYAENDLRIDFLSSPFSLEAVDMMEAIDLSSYKIASGEVNNIPLLVKIGKTRKKVYLSTGMSSILEIDEAVKTLRKYGCEDLTVLQCTSEYPCPPEEAGLNLISEFKEHFKDLKIGYSDHTIGNAIPLAAIVLGAEVIEKHFTLSSKMYGSDAKNSTEPNEFRLLVNEIRNLDVAISSKVNKDLKVLELKNMKETFEKSIVSARQLNVSDVISYNDLAYKKPGDGIPANRYKEIIGKKLTKSVNQNHKFKYEDFE